MFLFFLHRQNFSSKTLKRTRKFVVDGVEVSVTTSKVIREDEKKEEEMRFLRYVKKSIKELNENIYNSSLRFLKMIFLVL